MLSSPVSVRETKVYGTTGFIESPDSRKVIERLSARLSLTLAG